MPPYSDQSLSGRGDVGAAADFMLVDATAVAATPLADAVSFLGYAARGGDDATDTVIGGRRVLASPPHRHPRRGRDPVRRPGTNGTDSHGTGSLTSRRGGGSPSARPVAWPALVRLAFADLGVAIPTIATMLAAAALSLAFTVVVAFLWPRRATAPTCRLRTRIDLVSTLVTEGSAMHVDVLARRVRELMPQAKAISRRWSRSSRCMIPRNSRRRSATGWSTG